jgi:demethoxyubiquinone hydroxylase (CLK1/Coq7/Cat5 family)
VIDRIVRVDQAGELGANWIYRGQKMGMSIRGDRKAVKQIDVCPHSILRLLLLLLIFDRTSHTSILQPIVL